MYKIEPFDNMKMNELKLLFSEALPNRPKEYVDEKWWWTFSHPPLMTAVEQSTGLIVGVCAYVPFKAHSHGTDLPSAWFVDFFVRKEHQGRGVGKLLTKAVMTSNLITASLSQTDQAWFTFRKMGWNQRSTAKLFLNPFGYFPSLLAFLIKNKCGNTDLDVDIVSFDDITASHCDMIDQIWASGRGRFDIVSSRTSESLTERFTTRKNHRYKLIIARREGAPAGYMVIRTLPPNSLNSLRRHPVGKKKIGLIVDYFVGGSEAQVFRTLLRYALNDLLRSGARTFLCLCQVTSDQDDLVKSGFLHTGTPLIGRFLSRMDVGFTYFADVNLPVQQNPNWFLTLADCDMDRSWGESPV